MCCWIYVCEVMCCRLLTHTVSSHIIYVVATWRMKAIDWYQHVYLLVPNDLFWGPDVSHVCFHFTSYRAMPDCIMISWRDSTLHLIREHQIIFVAWTYEHFIHDLLRVLWCTPHYQHIRWLINTLQYLLCLSYNLQTIYMDSMCKYTIEILFIRWGKPICILIVLYNTAINSKLHTIEHLRGGRT